MVIGCTNQEGGRTVCTFSERMDTTQCLEAEKELMEIVENAEKLVFDLNGVEYIASSFLRLCGKASHKVNTENFSIINVHPAVKKVFVIAGLAERLNLN